MENRNNKNKNLSSFSVGTNLPSGVGGMFYNAHPLIFQKARKLRTKLTPAEESLWNYLQQGILEVKFRRQHPASIYVLDFYAHPIKLAIEIDGSIHANDEMKRNDEKRQLHLQSLGITFLRFSNQQVLQQIEFVLEKIKQTVTELKLMQTKKEIHPVPEGRNTTTPFGGGTILPLGLGSAITSTHFRFPGQKSFYKGKVRDVYNIKDELLVMVATDRISAFDVVLPRGIPYKGQVLNQIAAKFLQATQDIVPNWVLAVPDPMVTVGRRCEPFKVEMVIRGYLSGHAWRTYKSGKRELCGVKLPEGMKENGQFPEPIITPTTKASVGHDEDISKEEILKRKLISEEDYVQLEKHTRALFQRGTEMAEKMGLLLVDTKYEFGKAHPPAPSSEGVRFGTPPRVADQREGEQDIPTPSLREGGGGLYLIDEIHTPDSSRYFYKDGYQERQKKGEPQKQLSKEFVREWLIANNFMGKEGQKVPEMTDEIVNRISDRYIELYENITGERFQRADMSNVLNRIEENINSFLKKFYSSKRPVHS